MLRGGRAEATDACLSILIIGGRGCHRGLPPDAALGELISGGAVQLIVDLLPVGGVCTSYAGQAS